MRSLASPTCRSRRLTWQLQHFPRDTLHHRLQTGGASNIITALCPLSLFSFSAWNSRCALLYPIVTPALSQLTFPLRATALTLYLPSLNIASAGSLLLLSCFQILLSSEFRTLPLLIPHLRFCQTLSRGCKTLKKPLGSFRSLLGQRRNKKDFQRTRTTFLPVLEGWFSFLFW